MRTIGEFLYEGITSKSRVAKTLFLPTLARVSCFNLRYV